MPTKIINNDDFVSKYVYKKDQKAVEQARQHATCQDREHNPPSHIVLQPNQTMVHICPRCNKITIINNPITYHL